MLNFLLFHIFQFSNTGLTGVATATVADALWGWGASGTGRTWQQKRRSEGGKQAGRQAGRHLTKLEKMKRNEKFIYQSSRV
ncbi:hypothetical protein RUM44_002264 [Polyplax serrata]|uniref:Secreted protein n=1 Tax=Polyplax serrata TaxID=468196 RepID=A0ABR1AMD4_POLSC